MVLTETERPSTRILVVVVAFVVIGLVGLAVRSTGSDSSTDTGSAVLAIGGSTYAFTPSACTVMATDFLAAGSGRLDGQEFWISVSPEVAEVALGTSDERTRSDDGDDLWLMSDGPVRWEVTGDTVEADVTMRNERLPDAPLLRGRFTATCVS